LTSHFQRLKGLFSFFICLLSCDLTNDTLFVISSKLIQENVIKQAKGLVYTISF